MWTPIQYRGFWDVPRVFLARHRGTLFLFECLFDEELDDYPEDFRVFVMPDLRDDELPNDWTQLADRSIRQIGTVPVSRIVFDPSKRKQIDATILDELLAPAARASG